MKAGGLLFLLGFYVLVFSCQDTGHYSKYSNHGEPVIVIKPHDAAVILAPLLYKNVNYIILETHEVALVDGWHKTKIFDDYIGVLNQNPNNKFMLFDREGQYLWHRESGGKEPGNLFSTEDFTMLDDKVYFPDHLNKSIHVYDVTGKYLKSVVVNNSYSTLMGVGEYIVFSAKNLPRAYNEANQNVVFYDQNLHKVLNFGTVPRHLETINLTDIIYRSCRPNEVLYHQVLTDTIYRINTQQEISYYLIDHYPSLEIDKQDLKVTFSKQNGLFQKYIENPDDTYPIRDILDGENYLILFFPFKGRHFITAFSKRDSTSRTFVFDGDDMHNHVFQPGLKYTALDNTILVEMNVPYLRSIRRELPQAYLKENKIDLLLDNEEVDENANPVILTYELNEEYLDSLFGGRE